MNFLALAIYSRLLSPAEYGQYAIVVSIASMGGVFVFQWHRLVVARFLPANRHDPSKFLGEVLGVFLLLSAGVSILAISLLALPLSRSLGPLYLLGIFLLVSRAWLDLNLSIASTQLKPSLYGRLLGGKSALSLAGGVPLAASGLGAVAPLFGLILGNLFAVLSFGRSVWHDVRVTIPRRSVLVPQFRYGLPLVLTFALGWVISTSDRVLIGFLLGPEATGQYAVGYDLAQHSLGLILAVAQVSSYPLAVRALEERGPAAARDQVRTNGQLIIGLALAGAAGLIVLAPDISATLVGADFSSHAQDILPWIAVSAALSGIKSFHFDIAFHLGRDTRGLALCTFLAAVTNVALNFVLIPRLGIEGAALATLSSYSLGVLASGLRGRSSFRMPSLPSVLLPITGVPVAALIGATVGTLWLDGLPALVLGGLLGVSCSLVVAYQSDASGLKSTIREYKSRSR